MATELKGDEGPGAVISSLANRWAPIAVICWLVIAEMPAQRKEFMDELRAQREATSVNAAKITAVVQSLTEEVKRIKTPKE